MAIKNILLDRDGTIIEDRHYLHDPREVRLLPRAGKALSAMNSSGFSLFVVTNQSGIGRGYFQREDYLAVRKKLDILLQKKGAWITKSVFCPHSPADRCNCRKPGTGLWKELSLEFALGAQESAMIGDKGSDIAFARNCGLGKCILVLTGKGQNHAAHLGLKAPRWGWEEIRGSSPEIPDILASDLYAAFTALQGENFGY